jgi:RNA polymerase sigma-70 factor, ECF subfamily
VARRRCVQAARRLGLSDADAQDVAQETLLRAWRRLPTLRDGERFEPWLLAICRREALRLMRSRSRQPVAEIPEDEASPLDQMAAAEDRLALRDALGRLTPTDRRVLWLRFGEDLAHQQVANRLGLTETAVRIRTHRLRARLSRIARAPEL